MSKSRLLYLQQLFVWLYVVIVKTIAFLLILQISLKVGKQS